jgi:DNA mismatch repair ATPase MutS
LKLSHKIAVVVEKDDTDIRGLKERGLIQVITGGTLTDPDMAADNSRYNYLLCLKEEPVDRRHIFVVLDTLSRKCKIGATVSEDAHGSVLQALLEEMHPQEVLIGKKASDTIVSAIKKFGVPYITRRNETQTFKEQTLQEALQRLKDYEVSQDLKNCQLWNDKFAGAALNTAVEYLKETVMEVENPLSLYYIDLYNSYMTGDHAKQALCMYLDGNTLFNLQIFRGSDPINSRRGTLVDYLDHCKTNFGKRKFRDWMSRPLFCSEDIDRRLDTVDYLYSERNSVTLNIINILSNLRDTEHVINKIHQETNKFKKRKVTAEEINQIRKRTCGAITDLLDCLQIVDIIAGSRTKVPTLLVELINGIDVNESRSFLLSLNKELEEEDEKIRFIENQIQDINDKAIARVKDKIKVVKIKNVKTAPLKYAIEVAKGKTLQKKVDWILLENNCTTMKDRYLLPEVAKLVAQLDDTYKSPDKIKKHVSGNQ